MQVNASTLRVPDVSIVDAGHPIQRFATLPPVAVFEVLSPENSLTGMLRKFEEYRAMGIPHIWLIDPEEKVWRRFTPSGLDPSSDFTYDPLGISFRMEEIDALVR